MCRSASNMVRAIAIAGCTVHRNPFRKMVEDEEKAAAAKQASERFGADGQVQNVHKKGQWFSDPQSGVRQLAGAAPKSTGVTAKGTAAQPLALAASGLATSHVNGEKAKPSKGENSEFDAW